MHDVFGSEGIIFHNGNVVLGMQKQKRWYILDGNNKGAIVKTIGGSIEKEDKNSARKALKREISEEIFNLSSEDIVISRKKLFTKEIHMSDLNPFDKSSLLKMKANFYLVNILKKKIEPNDLPYLFEIPLKDFINLEFNKIIDSKLIEKYLIKNKSMSPNFPSYVALFVPLDVIEYLKQSEQRTSN